MRTFHIHIKWRRACALLLSFALFVAMLTLVSCRQPTPTPTPDNRLNFLTDRGVSIYRIVYPKNDCPAVVREAAENLQIAMEHILGTDVALTDDNGSDHATDQLQPYEILIGETARQATQNILSEIHYDDAYLIRVVGHKIIIAGGNGRATVAAVNHFIKTVIGYKEGVAAPEEPEVKIEQDYSYKGRYTTPMDVSETVETTLPYAPYRASVLYTIAAPTSAADALTLATLQGLSTRYGSEQIYIKSETRDIRLQMLLEDGNIALIDCDDENQPWTTGRLLNQYSDRLSGYILCSSDTQSDSAVVAINLAHHLNAVVVTPENEQVAQAAGLSCVLNATDKDDAWLRTTPYFAKMNKKVAVEFSQSTVPALVDYVVMTGCYYYDYQGIDHYMHLQAFKFLEKGAHLLTDKIEDESSEALSFSSIGVALYLVPQEEYINISVISGKLPSKWQEIWFGKDQ